VIIMGDVLDDGALDRWRREPVRFIGEVIRDPETGKPFELLPSERTFFDHAYRTDDAGKLLYPEQVYSCPKKSGKTAFAALHVLTTTLIYGGAFAEGYCAANDLEQSTGRVFQALRRIVEISPLLRREAICTSEKITFPAIGAVISAIASDYAGAAGGNPTISSFDELWGYTSERSRRLWDEMIPPPTRKIACRLTTTYGGFDGESVLLEELYKRGLALPEVGPDLRAGDGLLMFWAHGPVAPWQTDAWLAEMRRSLRPNAYLRMIENRFVSTESSFVDMDWWDACVDAEAAPVVADKKLPVWVGVDASVKRDSTALVAVTWDADASKVRLVAHRVFQPSRVDPLDFEATIERTVRDWCERYRVRGVHYDPYQMASVAQRLSAAGVPMREYPQSVGNLTAMGSNLFELIKGRGLVVYPDDGIRLAVSRAIAIETPRGWRIAKEKTSHKIDVVVALAMASLFAVEQGQAPGVVMVGPTIIMEPRVDMFSGTVHGGEAYNPVNGIPYGDGGVGSLYGYERGF
jgi:phage terminase large subunit-like protein